MPRRTRVQRYHLRVQYAGALYMCCPYCGHIFRRRINRKHWRVVCPDNNCRAKFIPVLSLAPCPLGGRQTTPPDFILPDADGPQTLQEAFPLGDIEFWRQGGCVHGLRERTAKQLIREMRVRAAETGQSLGSIMEQIEKEWGLDDE